MVLTNTIQPDFMAFFYPERYTTDIRGAGAVKAAAEERLNAAYVVVDEVLDRGGPFLLGNAVSIADLFLLMLVR
jgi:glutathione S-transferase